MAHNTLKNETQGRKIFTFTDERQITRKQSDWNQFSNMKLKNLRSQTTKRSG